MGTPSAVYFYRYSLFVLAIASNAIICSAAVWNLTIAQDANLSTQSHVDSYMIFLGAFSLLVVVPLLFLDVFSRRTVTGRVWAECLWIGSLWLLHLAGAITVSVLLPHDMCELQTKRLNSGSCTSARLIEVCSWICTVNLLIYLALLTVSALLHQKHDSAVWHASVRSYPWYLHFHCYQLRSRPTSPVMARPTPRLSIPAPQPRRPIHLPTQTALSAQYEIEYMPDPQTVEWPVHQPPAMQETRPPAAAAAVGAFTALYPLHIQAIWEPTTGPSPGEYTGIGPTPGSASSQQRLLRQPASSGEGPPPLGKWPRADIMSQPARPNATRKKVPRSAPSSAVERPREAEPGLPHSLPSSTQVSPDRTRPTGPRHRTRSSTDSTARPLPP
ncbi:hypothetical protein BC834DRAFT_966163 [Gloeopeniophorella convolvens]|nr:hypothetical protein BC834DRAFT_966163 [Gloeopeniophorella convolvens]